MDPGMNHRTPSDESGSYCDRVRLLLSMTVDGEATPDQRSEAEAHAKLCGDCRSARAADLAVRTHFDVALAALPGGVLVSTVGRLVALDIRATRSVNRFLMVSAAAAVLVALTVGMLSAGSPRSRGSGAPDADLLGQARASTRLVVSAPAIDRGR
jgi:anti-sigma factor RsiW